jgi:hypothetical protein
VLDRIFLRNSRLVDMPETLVFSKAIAIFSIA